MKWLKSARELEKINQNKKIYNLQRKTEDEKKEPDLDTRNNK